jgi:hypothetical protein
MIKNSGALVPLSIFLLVLILTGVSMWLISRSNPSLCWIPLAVLAVLIAGMVVFSRNLNLPKEPRPVVLNENGAAGTALVLYQPGISSFQYSVTHAFAEGLASQGWRVEMNTVGEHISPDLSAYDLLAVGGPVYRFSASVPVTQLLSRVGDLQGIATVGITTAAGSGPEASEMLKKAIEQANGNVVANLNIYQLAPNDEQFGSADALQIARRAGEQVVNMLP